MRKILIPVTSLVICFSVILLWTKGLSAFTIFSYTLADAGPVPRQMPVFNLVAQDSSLFTISDLHRFTLINFVYLNCPDVCHKMNNKIEEIYHEFDSTIVPSKLGFLTISFDLANDDIRKINKYREYFGEDLSGWTFALPQGLSEVQFDKILKEIGIWAHRVPDRGIINHSIYMFLVDEHQTIVKILDPARLSNAEIMNQISHCISGVAHAN